MASMRPIVGAAPLPAWFLLLALTAPVARANQDELARCATLEDDTVRLECYDRVARGAATAASEPPREAGADEPAPVATVEPELEELAQTMGAEVVGGWIYSESIDPLNGSASLVAMRPSDPAAGEMAQLLVGCVKVRRARKEIMDEPAGGEHRFVTRVAVGWGEYLGSDTYTEVSFAVDDAPADSAALFVDGQSVVASGETALELVGEFQGARRVAVGVLPYGDDAEIITAVFDLSGVDSVLAPLGRLCGW